MGLNFRTFTGLALLAVAGVSSASTYIWDDGSAEFSTVARGHEVLAVGYQVQPMQDIITSIEFYNFWNPGNGHAISYHLWTDPTNDGNMIDAVLAQTVATTIDAPGPNGNWQSVALPATQLAVGSWFYVGISFDDPTFSYFLGGQDTGAGASGNSWEFNWDPNGPSSPGNLTTGGMNHIVDADLLIRATGVPEPASMLSLGIGAALLLRRRRKA